METLQFLFILSWVLLLTPITPFIILKIAKIFYHRYHNRLTKNALVSVQLGVTIAIILNIIGWIYSGVLFFLEPSWCGIDCGFTVLIVLVGSFTIGLFVAFTKFIYLQFMYETHIVFAFVVTTLLFLISINSGIYGLLILILLGYVIYIYVQKKE